MAFDVNELTELLRASTQYKASDIHLRSGERPCFRIQGNLKPLKSSILSSEDIENICKVMIDKEDVRNRLSEINELDGSYSIESVCRVRFNLVRYQGNVALILRIISNIIPTFEELRLPKVMEKIAQRQRGLILVTGATGSGKSSTLASIVDYINDNKRLHIITLEDPVEFVHSQKKSRITQREIGNDTESYQDALRHALRQDPDIILIGEMRDAETMSIALKAAETGHLVLSTVHTTDVLSTIGRLVSMFPAIEQENVRKRLAINLYAIISQRLLPSKKCGRIPAVEILITNPGVRDCIYGKEDLEKIYTYMKSDKGQDGGQGFDQHIEELLKNKDIDQKTAVEAATSGDFLKRMMFSS